ncbi:MAG: glycine--tRNA ligase subunit beta [Desulfobacterales bacterium]|nr:glycine--tRNA ligase subunit beta [Desulfobacterales bacterium]
MTTLLLEIGAEEIPAGYIEPALGALAAALAVQLERARIDHGAINTYGTPRRLALMVADVADKQKSVTVEMMGPPSKIGFDDSGNPTVAAEKFAEKVGIKVRRLKTKKTEKGAYLYAKKVERGVATSTVLKQILPGIILNTPFPKTMRWMDLEIAFARPLHSILALLGDRVLSFTVGNVKSGRYTRGHSFMHPKKIKIKHPDDYIEALREASVIVDIAERKALVQAQVAAEAKASGGTVLEDPELVDIVTNLVEYPLATTGSFESEFLEVPREVLITAMREHQKYFAVVDAKGDLMSKFVPVNNTRTRDLALVATGHERVLRARLSDAKFFYEADIQVPAEERVAKLEGVLFQAKLGSMYAKTDRIGRLGDFLAGAVSGGTQLKTDLVRAARQCKSDLVSQVVVEFPKLQGVMGRVYAAVAGENSETASAIEEHYRPTRSGGALPETMTGSLLSIADKIDSICGCFSVGLVPTGAADPYALRRQGIGVIQIMRTRDLSFSLRELIRFGVEQFGDKVAADVDQVTEQIYVFLQRRLSRILVDEGFSKNVVGAVTSVSVDHIPNVAKRVQALEKLKGAADFEPLSVAFKRVANIMKKSGQAAGDAVDQALFEDAAEKSLYSAVQAVRQEVDTCLQDGNFDMALTKIASLRPPVDTFFDEVLVMADDDKIRSNRLALLGSIADLFGRFADFTKI